MNKTVVAVNRLYPHKQLTILMTMEAARVEAIMTLKANVIMVMTMEDGHDDSGGSKDKEGESANDDGNG